MKALILTTLLLSPLTHADDGFLSDSTPVESQESAFAETLAPLLPPDMPDSGAAETHSRMILRTASKLDCNPKKFIGDIEKEFRAQFQEGLIKALVAKGINFDPAEITLSREPAARLERNKIRRALRATIVTRTGNTLVAATVDNQSDNEFSGVTEEDMVHDREGNVLLASTCQIRLQEQRAEIHNKESGRFLSAFRAAPHRRYFPQVR